MTDFSKFGGRKFLMAMGAGLTGTALLVNGNIDQTHFVQLVQWTVTVYIAGGTVENMPAVYDKLKGPPK